MFKIIYQVFFTLGSFFVPCYRKPEHLSMLPILRPKRSQCTQRTSLKTRYMEKWIMVKYSLIDMIQGIFNSCWYDGLKINYLLVVRRSLILGFRVFGNLSKRKLPSFRISSETLLQWWLPVAYWALLLILETHIRPLNGQNWNLKNHLY